MSSKKTPDLTLITTDNDYFYGLIKEKNLLSYTTHAGSVFRCNKSLPLCPRLQDTITQKHAFNTRQMPPTAKDANALVVHCPGLLPDRTITRPKSPADHGWRTHSHTHNGSST